MRGDHRSQPRPAGYASLLRYRAAQWSPVPSRNAARDGTGAPVEIIEITADTSALRAIVRDLLQTFRMQVPGRLTEAALIPSTSCSVTEFAASTPGHLP